MINTKQFFNSALLALGVLSFATKSHAQISGIQTFSDAPPDRWELAELNAIPQNQKFNLRGSIPIIYDPCGLIGVGQRYPIQISLVKSKSVFWTATDPNSKFVGRGMSGANDSALTSSSVRPDNWVKQFIGWIQFSGMRTKRNITIDWNWDFSFSDGSSCQMRARGTVDNPLR